MKWGKEMSSADVISAIRWRAICSGKALVILFFSLLSVLVCLLVYFPGEEVSMGGFFFHIVPRFETMQRSALG